MSGSLSGGGVDASIALNANRPIPPNPLQTIGQFADVQAKINQNKLFPGMMQLQQQQMQGNTMSLAQQLKQTAYAHIAAGVANGTITDHASLTNALGSLEHNYGIPTNGVISDISNLAGGDGPAFVNNLKGLTVAGTQSPENAVRAISPVPGMLNTGGQDIPTLAPAAGMPGQLVPVQAAPGFQRGYTPGEQLADIHRPATQADIDAGRASAIGQDIIAPRTTLPATGGYNPGVGGARIPAGALGPGGYAAPRRPLDQLGAPYRPPGAPAPGASPPMPGGRLMKGPGGTFMVPADKIAVFQQNGYQ